MMKTRQDPTTAPEPHLLGNGNFQLNVQHLWRDTTERLYFAWRACGPGWGSTTTSGAEIAKLVDLLDSAAVEVRGGFARPPTLRTPYAMEVSCPATGEPSHWLPFPATLPASERTATEIGVRFVLDTTGQVEPGSVFDHIGVFWTTHAGR